ncbi:MAG TPA: hypothetical protein DIT13_19530 [Verrucomicrobiales bacterium]|nr:hypothetical protein [Verrucomicrobiales bacterium]
MGRGGCCPFARQLFIFYLGRPAETEDTIATLAVEIGFYDYAYFKRCFRHTIGLSPARYRHQQLTPRPARRA